MEAADEASLETTKTEGADEAGLKVTTIKAADEVGLDSAEDAGLNFAEDAGLNFTEEAGLNFIEEAGLNFTEEAGLNFAEDAGLNSADEAVLNSVEDAGLNSADEAGLNSTEDAGLNSADEAGLNSAEDAGLNSAEDAGLNSADEAGLNSADEAGLRTINTEVPDETCLEVPNNAGLKTIKMEIPDIEVADKKTPIVWVEEISRKEGQAPIWTITELDTTIRRLPRYKCILAVTYKGQDLVAEVEACSKKEAKNAAARAMLNDGMKLTAKDYVEINRRGRRGVKRGLRVAQIPPEEPEKIQVIDTSEEDEGIIVDDADVGPNIVGELIEYCHKLQWDDPVYKELPTTGPPHCLTYNFMCTINGIAKSEKSKTKKQAKRRVAYKWLTFLQGPKQKIDFSIDEGISSSDFESGSENFSWMAQPGVQQIP